MKQNFFGFAGIVVMVLVVVFALLFSGCVGERVMSPTELKESFSSHVGEKVVVKGVVKNSLKIGQLSAFQLGDDSSTISVSSELLPPEGKTVLVKGTVVKDTLFGYYVLAKEVRVQ